MDTIDFVSMSFDEVFCQEEIAEDLRFLRLKQMVKTLQKSRESRKRGFVGISLSVMDDLKYVDENLREFYGRCISGDLGKLDAETRKNYEIYVAGFGETVTNDKGKIVTANNSGWHGSLDDFIHEMHAHSQCDDDEVASEDGEFYFCNFPNSMINKQKTKFMFFVTVYKNEDQLHDVAHIVIVGTPTDAMAELQHNKILRMFGYK